MILYALVRGLRPRRALEIGVRWGNSARIITNAMQENNVGQLVGIDPIPEAFRVKARHLHGRYRLIRGYSPEAIPEAVEALGGPLDFVFIDGLHTHDAVLDDLQGVLPHLAWGGHVLLHDAYHQGIAEAANKVVRADPDVVDCGFVSRSPDLGSPVAHQGLRLLRVGTLQSEELIGEAYQHQNWPQPQLTSDAWNFDPYAQRTGRSSPTPATTPQATAPSS